MKKNTRILFTLLLCCSFLFAKNTFAGKADTATHRTSFCFLFGTVLTQQNEKCYGQSNGVAVVAPIPGTGTKPYTYSWSPAATNFSLDTADVGYGLSAGSYTVTITDSLGCTTNVTVTITQPAPVTGSASSVTNETCHGGNNGSATIVAAGGTKPYTYNWTPTGGTAASASNLTAGTYIIHITDSNKCAGTDTLTITQPVAINIMTAMVPSSCKTPNGSAGVTASMGVSPYTYMWAPGGNTTDSITALGAGIYTCTVTDSHGCKDSAAITVKDSTTLRDSVKMIVNENCNGSSNGSASVSVKGGKGTVTYAWSPAGGTDTTSTTLPAGTYTFTATDSVGCIAPLSITISQPSAIRDSMIRVRNVACFGGTTGRVSVGVIGGTTPYTYTWSNGATASNITNVSAGTYSVAVVDGNGCKDSATINITQPATAVADSNKVMNLTCYGSANGSARVYAYGGISPYTYSWGAGGSTADSSGGLSAGTYIVRVRDSNRCTIHDTIKITQPASLVVKNDTLLSSSGCNNTAWIILKGSMSHYTFAWSPVGTTSDTAKSLCSGTYYVSIYNDSTGCSQTDTIVIPSPVGIQQLVNGAGIKVYPNPTKSQLSIDIADNSFNAQYLSIYDMTGREVMTEKVSQTASLITIDVSKLANGTYFLKLIGNSIKLVKFSVAGR